MKQEIWKEILNYEGLYEVSNLGNVRSCKTGNIKAQCLDNHGYPLVCLCKNGVNKTWKVHLLVWDVFGDGKRNGKKIAVDHKDEIKTHNWIDNLQILKSRDNKSKSVKRTRIPTGLQRTPNGRWRTKIRIGDKQVYLGTYDSLGDAHQAYLKAKQTA